ncbi:hypothetical protein CLOP_g1786 [Closterium sp. NIES-67]|nr:hypothetical protein CLOP_g1786 [Closterium sp. NIES-67]
MLDAQLPSLDELAHEEVSQFDMLGSLVEDRVFGEVDGALVITPQSRGLLRIPELSHEVELLRESDGSSFAIPRDFHPKVVLEFPEVLHGESVPKSLLNSCQLIGVLGDENHIVNVHENEERVLVLANEETRIG